MTGKDQDDVNLSSWRKNEGCFSMVIDRVRKYAGFALLILIALFILFQVTRAAVYKIRPWERGLHVRGGKFIKVDEPGWHIQIPFVDTVIGVVVSEQLGEIDELEAMTSDEVAMDVSLIYTYRVIDPVSYRLEVLDPQAIISRFVQATLRDIINDSSMSDVMHNRAAINIGLLQTLREKESNYGIQFVTVQLQSASPPVEVVTAIKDRMVAIERQDQAEVEATQMRILADAEAYSTQKNAEAQAFEIQVLAEAEAERQQVLSDAEKDAAQNMLEVLESNPDLADMYIQLLIARELEENSKWIISGSGDLSQVFELPFSP